MRSSFSVYPRYTAGSPAQVPEATCLRVLRQETEAIEFVLLGYEGPEEQRKAETKGLAGIAIEHWELRNHRFEKDLYTGEVKRYPIKHGHVVRA